MKIEIEENIAYSDFFYKGKIILGEEMLEFTIKDAENEGLSVIFDYGIPDNSRELEELIIEEYNKR